ncbi:protein HAPLESS 2-like [Rutidosis leptorrhynchoides]|uniref:protein HAPLESS 2-like n=1 Tax=Rutidosis leptorrhynchoides TaxID=125765 RepID=UPI003A9A2059
MKPLVFISLIFTHQMVNIVGVQILSKSKLEKCEKVSGNINDHLNCTKKIVIEMAVPSEANGTEASIVSEVAEVHENTSVFQRTLRTPPVITIKKSAVYALYELTYIRDVAYKPEEYSFMTRKCEADGGENIVGPCVSLRDDKGHVIQHTQPTCCPCGKWRRVPSSCGSIFNTISRGKANTAHCLRFPGDWFHVFGIGRHSIGFNIRISVKSGGKTSDVVIGPNNRTATSLDNFLRANLIGDYSGYTNVPSFEEFFLVIPRQGGPGQPREMGRNFSMWMLLERVRFTLDGLDCDKIGVGYEAFNSQPSFCSAPFKSCIHNQLWNFWESDKSRIDRRLDPLYVVQGKYPRINEHPHAGKLSFSVGITEAINSNLLLELSADDIQYVYQRSPGNIISITIPTFEALTQFGIAAITANNTGQVEASYSVTFDCSGGVSPMEEQYFIMKPNEVVSRYFRLFLASDQEAKYVCTAILKDSDFHEVHRAECQFTTTAMVLDSGTQLPFEPPKEGEKGFFDSIEEWWHAFWDGLVDFITGKNCSRKCSSFFDFNCHLHNMCITWMLLFGLFSLIFPTVVTLVWLLHEYGVFDPIYDWWEDHIWDDEHRIQHIKKHGHHKKKPTYHTEGHHKRRKHTHPEQHVHHAKKNERKHGRIKGTSSTQHPLYMKKGEDDIFVNERRQRKERDDNPHKHLRSKRKG